MVLHFRDETYGDVKTPGYNGRGRIVPVPFFLVGFVTCDPKQEIYLVMSLSAHCTVILQVYRES
jgi:hypothetical protein